MADKTTKEPAKKVQRIKLRMCGHPVKLDATLKAMAENGEWLDVEFDGPLQDCRLYRYGKDLLCDVEKCQSAVTANARIFEVI